MRAALAALLMVSCSRSALDSLEETGPPDQMCPPDVGNCISADCACRKGRICCCKIDDAGGLDCYTLGEP